MNRKILLQGLSALSAATILALDSQTPLGFAHGDLYLFSLILAALTGDQRFLAVITTLSVLFTAAGVLISPPGLGIEYWLPNRAMSIIELCIISALTLFMMRHQENLRSRQQQLETDNEQLRELTPSPDNPLSPLRHRTQFEMFADAIPQIIWTADTEGRVDYTNTALASYTGLERETLVSSAGWLRAISPDDVYQVRDRWREAIQQGHSYELEFRLLRHDGAWRWHLIQAMPLYDEQGNIIKWCGSCIDIHDMKLFAERFEHVAKATVDAIWDWEIDNASIWWNHGISTLFGYDADEELSTPAVWSRYVHPEDREHRLARIQQTMQSDENFMNVAYRFLRADGSVADIEEYAFVMRNRDGRPVRMVGGMTDVTERKLMAEQLSHAQRLQTVGELTGGMAHDFNNLLTVIQGNNELLAEALANQPALASLTSMIDQASERAARLVQRLLAFARKQPLDPRPTDVQALINNLQSLVRRALPKGIQLRFVAEPALPAIMIDPPQLESALLNLCLNARDAMNGNGEILIEARQVTLDGEYCAAHPDVQPGQYMLMSVADQGYGMSAEVKARAFDPFFTTKKAGQGSGLGLSMVYGFVNQSGGLITVDSEPGTGTVISMYLPLATAHASARVSDEPAVAAEACAQHATVLIVEDNALVRRYAEKQFRELGYDVICAGDGSEALELLTQHKTIDLLFTDVMMSGGMNGPELARAALDIKPALPILFTSGYSDVATSHQDLLQADIPMLNKPWRRDDLAEKLEKLNSDRR